MGQLTEFEGGHFKINKSMSLAFKLRTLSKGLGY